MMKRHFNRTANLMMCHVSHKFGIRWIATFTFCAMFCLQQIALKSEIKINNYNEAVLLNHTSLASSEHCSTLTSQQCFGFCFLDAVAGTGAEDRNVL